MDVRASRKAGGADIADDLALAHGETGLRDDAAHVRIAGYEPARVRDANLAAVPARISGAEG